MLSYQYHPDPVIDAQVFVEDDVCEALSLDETLLYSRDDYKHEWTSKRTRATPSNQSIPDYVKRYCTLRSISQYFNWSHPFLKPPTSTPSSFRADRFIAGVMVTSSIVTTALVAGVKWWLT